MCTGSAHYKMNRRYILLHPSSIDSIILPHLSLVVHSTYAVEFFELFSSTVVSPGMRFQFFTCAKTFSTGTRLLECALFCAFLSKPLLLIVLYQCQAYAVVGMRCDLSIWSGNPCNSGHGSFPPWNHLFQ